VAPEGTYVFQLHFGALDEADQATGEVARFFKRLYERLLRRDESEKAG